jgi:hypothetical protein
MESSPYSTPEPGPYARESGTHMVDRRYLPKPPRDSRVDPDSDPPHGEESKPGDRIERFEDLDPRKLQLRIAYMVQDNNRKTEDVAIKQEEQELKIQSIDGKVDKVVRRQRLHDERLEAIEKNRPSLSIPPTLGRVSPSGHHLLVDVQDAMKQQLEHEKVLDKSKKYDWLTSKAGVIAVALVLSSILACAAWVSRALTLAASLHK